MYPRSLQLSLILFCPSPLKIPTGTPLRMGPIPTGSTFRTQMSQVGGEHKCLHQRRCSGRKGHGWDRGEVAPSEFFPRLSCSGSRDGISYHTSMFHEYKCKASYINPELAPAMWMWRRGETSRQCMNTQAPPRQNTARDRTTFLRVAANLNQAGQLLPSTASMCSGHVLSNHS